MRNEFLTTGPRRHKQYILMTCVIRTIACMRQDEAIASSWFWLFFLIFVFLKKRLIEKIIPRKNWICLQSISEPLDLKIFLNKKFNETVVLGLRLVPLHPHDVCKWIPLPWWNLWNTWHLWSVSQSFKWFLHLREFLYFLPLIFLYCRLDSIHSNMQWPSSAICVCFSR